MATPQEIEIAEAELELVKVKNRNRRRRAEAAKAAALEKPVTRPPVEMRGPLANLSTENLPQSVQDAGRFATESLVDAGTAAARWATGGLEDNVAGIVASVINSDGRAAYDRALEGRRKEVDKSFERSPQAYAAGAGAGAAAGTLLAAPVEALGVGTGILTNAARNPRAFAAGAEAAAPALNTAKTKVGDALVTLGAGGVGMADVDKAVDAVPAAAEGILGGLLLGKLAEGAGKVVGAGKDKLLGLLGLGKNADLDRLATISADPAAIAKAKASFADAPDPEFAAANAVRQSGVSEGVTTGRGIEKRTVELGQKAQKRIDDVMDADEVATGHWTPEYVMEDGEVVPSFFERGSGADWQTGSLEGSQKVRDNILDGLRLQLDELTKGRVTLDDKGISKRAKQKAQLNRYIDNLGGNNAEVSAVDDYITQRQLQQLISEIDNNILASADDPGAIAILTGVKKTLNDQVQAFGRGDLLPEYASAIDDRRLAGVLADMQVNGGKPAEGQFKQAVVDTVISGNPLSALAANVTRRASREAVNSPALRSVKATISEGMRDKALRATQAPAARQPEGLVRLPGYAVAEEYEGSGGAGESEQDGEEPLLAGSPVDALTDQDIIDLAKARAARQGKDAAMTGQPKRPFAADDDLKALARTRQKPEEALRGLASSAELDDVEASELENIADIAAGGEGLRNRAKEEAAVAAVLRVAQRDPYEAEELKLMLPERLQRIIDAAIAEEDGEDLALDVQKAKR